MNKLKLSPVDVLSTIITHAMAEELVRTLLPHLKTSMVTINHVGSYDKHGSRHADAIGVINFNDTDQITIWNSGIKYYCGGFADEKTTGDVFNAYRLLHKWGVVA